MKRISFVLFIVSFATICLGQTRMTTTHPQQTCQRKCRTLAQHLYRECRQNGGSDEQCRQAAHELLDRCIEETCHAGPTCEMRCQHEAITIFNTCIDAQEPTETCAGRARAALFECLTQNCNMPAGCKDKCLYLGQSLARLCIAEGGTQEQCSSLAHHFVEHCIHEGCAACGGIAGTPCPKGEFCLFPPGTCDVADNLGVCMPVPEACPTIYHPVCGCDGQTYGNVCEAAMAGVSVDYPGPCVVTCGGITGEKCPEGQFCQFPPGECDVADNQGRCTIPTACPDVYQPVCGCDGNTYQNPCFAAQNETSIDHAGPCGQACGGIDHTTCPGGMFCQLEMGHCTDPNAEGVCQEYCPSCYCTTEWDPVCGCDGNTYGNACGATVAGVSIDHPGPCEP